MNLFFHTFPADVLLPTKNFLLILCLVGMVVLTILSAEGCVKRPSLEPAPGAVPQQLLHT